jgi:hypothetical protein
MTPTIRGRLRGKPPKLSPRHQQHLLGLYRSDEKTIPELAELQREPRDRLPGHPTRRAPTARRGRDRRRLSFTLV